MRFNNLIIFLIVIIGVSCRIYSANKSNLITADNNYQSSILKNLALNRAAYQSSSNSYDNTAHLVTDGQEATYWTSQPSDTQWIYVDFGKECDVNRVVLKWKVDYAKSYQIQKSNDTKSWTDVYSTKNEDGGCDTIIFNFPQSTRFIRMLGTERGTSGGYSISELEVYGTGGLVQTSFSMPPILSDGTQYLTRGNWKLQRAAFIDETGEVISEAGFDDSSWIPATVPGTVLTSYLSAGAIPDPNYGDQQLMISESFFNANFWYRNEFILPESYEGKKVWLNFDGINWKADVYVNGTFLGNMKGAFIRRKFEISQIVICDGVNALAVLIHNNDNPGNVTVQDLSNPGNNGGVLGKDNPTMHASIGWDWVPTIRGRNCGIYNDVYLSQSGPVSIIDPFVITDLPLPDTSYADISIQVELRNNTDSVQSGFIEGTIDNITVKENVILKASEVSLITLNKTTHPRLSICEPELWWPNGYGGQKLHNLELKFVMEDGIVSDSDTISFGIRELFYDVSDALKIYVNGKRIWCRGGNWGMDESMLRCDKQGYDIRVRFHKDMNFTMIRNWVGMTSDKDFYSACDKYGILVWDDFNLANPKNGPDPNDNTLFMEYARDKIRQFRNHPSLALYCGRNEGDPPEPLYTELPKAVDELDGTRFYIQNSRGEPLLSGNGPWRVKDPKWYFINNSGRAINSERGMPNVPSIESMRAMIPEDKLWPLNDLWGIHDFCLERFQTCTTYVNAINARYGIATSAEDFCLKAQMVNMNNHKAIYEAQSQFRNGILLWMSNPAWPSTVWQTYDFYFEPTAGYFGCKKGCEPLHIQWNCLNENIKIVNTSGRNRKNLNSEVWIYNMDGTQKYYQSVTIDCPNDSTVNCLTLSYPPGLSNVHFIKLVLKSEDEVLSENFYWRGLTYLDYKDLSNMSDVKLKGSARKTVSEGKCVISSTIQNPSANIALMIRLKMLKDKSMERVLPVIYEDNYFSVLPNESKNVSIEFDPKYLSGENPKLMVQGWNVIPGEIQILDE